MKAPLRYIITEVDNPGYYYISFIENSILEEGNWYWCIMIDGGCWADGETETEEEALVKLKDQEEYLLKRCRTFE